SAAGTPARNAKPRPPPTRGRLAATCPQVRSACTTSISACTERARENDVKLALKLVHGDVKTPHAATTSIKPRTGVHAFLFPRTRGGCSLKWKSPRLASILPERRRRLSRQRVPAPCGQTGRPPPDGVPQPDPMY